MFNVVGNTTDVNIQDQTSPSVIVKMSNIASETVTTALNAIDDTVITVADATGIVIGQYLTMYSVNDNRVYFGTVTNVATLDITLDTPLDFAFPIGTSVTTGISNMAVNGSVTTQIFGVRNTDVSIPLIVDITRIIFTCEATSAVDLSLFGNLASLAKGIVLRKVNGENRNIFNAKNNKELANLMYDFQIYAATNPSQGEDGFVGRLTFAGQNKVGVAIRLGPGEDLQMLVQDNLSTLTSFTALIEGHEVVD